ncbi:MULTISPECIES: hypothetical protein [unclassified Chryseobacterium]|uniref:hypothetical protein n=1 Tax=unclassified Chryseobacterium TaxID=2593645 RepID=UPI003015C9F9
MEINTAFALGIIFSTYGFLFCIFAYYLSSRFLKLKVDEVHVFSTFGKPLYSYSLKNGVKINFGYIPFNYGLKFHLEDFSLDSPEGKRYFRNFAKNISLLQVVTMVLIIVVGSFVSLMYGYNPITIFTDLIENFYDLIAGKQSFSEFKAMVNSQYITYGKYFYLFFAAMTYFVFVSFLLALAPFSVFTNILVMFLILGSYVVMGLKYFELPISFYIDLLISITVSGFLYFLSLRFFIK